MTYKELYDIAMPPYKRGEDKVSVWVHYVVRPFSILLSIPLLNTNVTPTTVTKLSIISCLIGFFMLVLYPSIMLIKIIGWTFIFLWAILDGVDGNIARAKNQCSLEGDLWDTIGGYAAMVLINFSAGIVAFYDNNTYVFFPSEFFLILGGATSFLCIFPRLVMHKRLNQSKGGIAASQSLTDKSNFGIVKLITNNIIGVSGMFQVIFLLSIIFHMLNIFVVMYFIINFFVMVVGIYKVTRY